MTLVEAVITLMCSNALIGFVQFMITRHDLQKDSPAKVILRELAADRLRVKIKDWMHSDVRTAVDWEIIECLYLGYADLGGNGEIKKLYEEARQIPTTEGRIIV